MQRNEIFCLDTLIDRGRIRTDSKQSLYRQMLPDQRLGLIALLLSRVVRIMLEILAVQKVSVDLVQVVQIGEIARHERVSVLVRENERNPKIRNSV